LGYISLSENQLRENELRYRRVAQLTSDIAYSCLMDKEGSFIINWISGASKEITGYSNDEIKDKGCWRFLVLEEDNQIFLDNVISLDAGMESICQLRLRHKNGDIIWISSYAECVSEEEDQGQTILYGSITNITTNKLLKEELDKSESNYRFLVENSHDIIYQLDNKGIFLFASPAITKTMGYSLELLIGRSIREIIHPEDVALYRAVLQKVIDFGEKQESAEYRVRKLDGTWRWHMSNLTPYSDETGKIIGVIGVSRDITKQKEVEKNLLNQNILLEGVINAIPDVLAIQYPDHRIERYNKSGYDMLNMTQDQIGSKKCYELIGRSEECAGCATRLALKTKKLESVERYVPELDIYLDCHSNPILDEKGNILYVVEQLRDITDKKNEQLKIEFLSFHDQLTGLYNRRFYEEELKHLDTERNLPLTLAIMDVNGLKFSNDTFGHAYGDDILRKVAQILKEECQSDDIVARIGGDEFVIILPKTGSEQASLIVDRIRSSINNEKINSINLSVSFGWETKVNKDEEIEKVFKKAEDYMYRNKLSESDSIRHETIKVVMKTLYEKNNREEKHSKRVSEYCEKMGIAFGLGKEDVKELKIVGLMHDIGKITINDDILNKPFMLSDSEWSSIKRHPEIGYRILSSVNEYSNLAKFVLAHHERWDGKGYPKGLMGEEIPLQSRIIAVIDAYDAMTGYRPYRKSLDKEAAVKEILKNAGTQFDSQLVKIFVEQVLEN
jgi:diguanylate cyclase (GGDEF)-like protein/PAS domain S-box-containing protein